MIIDIPIVHGIGHKNLQTVDRKIVSKISKYLEKEGWYKVNCPNEFPSYTHHHYMNNNYYDDELIIRGVSWAEIIDHQSFRTSIWWSLKTLLTIISFHVVGIVLKIFSDINGKNNIKFVYHLIKSILFSLPLIFTAVAYIFIGLLAIIPITLFPATRRFIDDANFWTTSDIKKNLILESVKESLEWDCENTRDKQIIIAHSQGGSIVHYLLSNDRFERKKSIGDKLITIGSGSFTLGIKSILNSFGDSERLEYKTRIFLLPFLVIFVFLLLPVFHILLTSITYFSVASETLGDLNFPVRTITGITAALAITVVILILFLYRKIFPDLVNRLEKLNFNGPGRDISFKHDYVSSVAIHFSNKSRFFSASNSGVFFFDHIDYLNSKKRVLPYINNEINSSLDTEYRSEVDFDKNFTLYDKCYFLANTIFWILITALYIQIIDISGGFIHVSISLMSMIIDPLPLHQNLPIRILVSAAIYTIIALPGIFYFGKLVKILLILLVKFFIHIIKFVIKKSSSKLMDSFIRLLSKYPIVRLLTKIILTVAFSGVVTVRTTMHLQPNIYIFKNRFLLD